jgi:hypothetical protein
MSDSAKKGILVTVAVVLVGYALYTLLGSFGDDVQKAANTQWYMDKDTKKLYDIELKEGMKPYPVKNPSTGDMTLYPTEVCYKNECQAAGGTHVIMNELLGIPGSTYCPKCGALVVFHNPGPRRDFSDPEVQEILNQAGAKKGD